MIRSAFSTASLSLCVAALLFGLNLSAKAQIDFAATRTAQDIIASYGTKEKAFLNMNRAEWAVVGKSPEFSEEELNEALRMQRDSFKQERESRAQLRAQQVQNDDCGCWVEPDDTYITMVQPAGIFGPDDDELEWENQADWSGSMLIDVASGPIEIAPEGGDPWSFNLYGEEFEFFFINSNGQVSFGTPVLDWNPQGFPAAAYNQIAGYWADSDLRTFGDIKFKVTADAVYVNYIDVGHYSNSTSLTNSYQIILARPESGVLPDGNNAQVCYLNMEWAHGDFDGGSNGCCGNTPGITGADNDLVNPDPISGNHVQFGRFNLLNDTYNGPYGDDDDEQDGVYWLNGKKFNINTTSNESNLSPVATASLDCSTLQLCLGQTLDLGIEFLGPEPNQTVELSIVDDLGNNTITDSSTTQGDQAAFAGTFTAVEPGTSTITMTAVDNLGGTTIVPIVIEVLDVVPPSILVENVDGSDEFSMCAGSQLDLEASSVGGAEDIIDWSWSLNPQYWEDNQASIPFGGTFTVTGNTASGCVVKEAVVVGQSPYYLPNVVGSNVTLCPGQTATVEVVPDADQTFVAYQWVADWQGGGGTIEDGQGDSVAELTAGLYQLTVTDGEGCQGRYTFPIAETSVNIPDFSVPAICDFSEEVAEDSVVFEGGFASPEVGYYFAQLLSGEGWNSAYLEVQVISPDTTVASLLTTSQGFEAIPQPGNEDEWPELAIELGDSVLVIFNTSGDPLIDQELGVNLYNCVANCSGDNANCLEFNGLTDGDTLYYGPATCAVQPAYGTWSVTSGQDPDDYAFSNMDEFNTTFYVHDYGVYDLTFVDDVCQLNNEYTVEVTLPPTIELSVFGEPEDSIVQVCGDDILELQAFVTDPGGSGIINWPPPGNDNQLFNDYSWSEFFEGPWAVTVENGCGEAIDQLEVTAIPEPDMGQQLYVCGETSDVELDPIEGDEDSGLEYQWTYNGNLLEDVIGNEWNVSETGSYCVIVPSEDCPSSYDDDDCVFVDIVLPIDVEVFSGGSTTDCDGGGIEAGAEAVLGVNPAFVQAYADYTITWPDGTVTTQEDGFEWVLPDEADNSYNGTTITVLIEDPYGCEAQTDSGLVFIGDVPTWDPQPVYDGIKVICKGQEEVFDLNANFNGPEYSDYSWSVQCTDTLVVFQEEDVAVLEYEDFPEGACTGYDVVLLAEIANPCLPGGIAHEFDIRVENCEIEPVNVFSPQSTPGSNPSFWIKGLEPWEDDPEGVFVQIFDRWGNKVYENAKYRNETSFWSGDGSAPGVYFYTIILPNDEEFTGTVNIFR